jgi:hypothetical protein
MTKKTFKDLFNEINVIEPKLTINKPKQIKGYTKIKDIVPLIKDYNFMSDLLFLPTTTEGYKYLFVIVDLASDNFDIEPLKTKEPAECLKALLKIFKRKTYIKAIHASLTTDAGNEFKGSFNKYLWDNGIYHKTTVPGRHSQNANVESLNRQLGRLINGYLNQKEEKSHQTERDWLPVIKKIRVSLNKHREKKLPDDIFTYVSKENRNPINIPDKRNLFKKNDLVHYKLDRPRNALNQLQNTTKNRVGDYIWSKELVKIISVFIVNAPVFYRYMLEGQSNVSYTEDQLMK